MANHAEGSPRIDPKERLLHRFYEPLHFLAILNGSRGAGETDLPMDSQSRDFKIRWRRFLDDLSWLCDNKHGGETVSAVAAQSVPEGNKFWLVTKHEASFEHFLEMFEELKSLRNQSDEEMKETAHRIAEASILFSRDKIKNYARFLKLFLRKATEREEPLGTIVSGDMHDYGPLVAAVEALIRLADDPLELCRASNAFDKHKTIDRLLRMHSSTEERSPWASIRHYIGRLSCWFNKCRNMVQLSAQFPHLLHDATCEYIPLPRSSKLPTADSKTNLRSALKRMLPTDQQHVVETLYDQVRSLRTFDIPGVFVDNITDERLTRHVHAEVYLAEHFYFNRLQFVGREKYIGCSKPSCYCCSLYFRFHPGNFVMRPAHNNIFVMWCPPLLLELDEEPKWKHTLDVVNQINAYMRRDILEEIEHRIPRRERGPDSTTGAQALSLISHE